MIPMGGHMGAYAQPIAPYARPRSRSPRMRSKSPVLRAMDAEFRERQRLERAQFEEYQAARQDVHEMQLDAVQESMQLAPRARSKSPHHHRPRAHSPFGFGGPPQPSRGRDEEPQVVMGPNGPMLVSSPSRSLRRAHSAGRPAFLDNREPKEQTGGRRRRRRRRPRLTREDLQLPPHVNMVMSQLRQGGIGGIPVPFTPVFRAGPIAPSAVVQSPTQAIRPMPATPPRRTSSSPDVAVAASEQASSTSVAATDSAAALPVADAPATPQGQSSPAQDSPAKDAPAQGTPSGHSLPRPYAGFSPPPVAYMPGPPAPGLFPPGYHGY